MNTVITDRRESGDKVFASERRFKRRGDKLIQEAVREAVRKGEIEIKGISKGGEISISRDGLDEPWIKRGGEHIRRRVLPGNKEFIDGDILPRPEGGGGSGKNGTGNNNAGIGNGQDAFRFTLTREEFINAFLADLELPDLEKKQLAQVEREGFHRMGYARTGSPPNLSIKRTLQESKKRRMALKRPKKAEIVALERAIETAEGDERISLIRELKQLKRRRAIVPFLEERDLRYRRLVPQMRPSTKAVMFCVMDVSGSMTEHMKGLAKRFFILLNIFLTTCYKRVEIVFIRHTDKAEEVDERTFFYGIETGGTVVSTAFVEMDKVIKSRFPPEEWNIYVAQASDGDNMGNDEQPLRKLLETILPVTQYFAYLEVSGGSSGVSKKVSEIWALYSNTFERIKKKKASEPRQIYPVFRELFQRAQKDGHESKGAMA